MARLSCVPGLVERGGQLHARSRAAIGPSSRHPTRAASPLLVYQRPQGSGRCSECAQPRFDAAQGQAACRQGFCRGDGCACACHGGACDTDRARIRPRHPPTHPGHTRIVVCGVCNRQFSRLVFSADMRPTVVPRPGSVSSSFHIRPYRSITRLYCASYACLNGPESACLMPTHPCCPPFRIA